MFVDESSTKHELLKMHIGNYRMSIPLIALNFILLAVSAYGGYSIDYYLMNTTTNPITYQMYHVQLSDYQVWVGIFFSMFLMNVLLLFANVFYYMKETTFDPINIRKG